MKFVGQLWGVDLYEVEASAENDAAWVTCNIERIQLHRAYARHQGHDPEAVMLRPKAMAQLREELGSLTQVEYRAQMPS